jgi:Tfp pilus assembly protein PilF
MPADCIRFATRILLGMGLLYPFPMPLRPEQQGTSSYGPDKNNDSDYLAPTALDSSTQRALNKALEELRDGNPGHAKKHLEKVSSVAPANPDVTCAWGMYYAQTYDWAKAQSYWQTTLMRDPRQAFALAGMAQFALKDGDISRAIDYLERAVQAPSSSWHLEERLAEAYLLHQQYDLAQQHAEHALELGEGQASLAPLVLAKVLFQRNESERARKVLDTLLAQQPLGLRSEEARSFRSTLWQSAGVTQLAEDGSASAKAAAFAFPEELVPPTKWMPPDVDKTVPAVETGVACPLEQVRELTGKRVRDFVSAVNRISAMETLDQEVIDRYGSPSKHESRHYAYVVSVQEVRPGRYSVEEYRNGKTGSDIFPDHISTFGLTSLVMIFHPAYRDEYEISCEGLSRWHEAATWQVHFRQRPDKPARFRGYHVGNQWYSISLRGRAWVAVDTFQIVHIETDLLAPVPQIRLNAEHISVNYAPVQFRTSKQELWLPQSADLFVDFDMRRIHRLHHFTEYALFSVDETQKISVPLPKPRSDPPP